MASTDVMRRRPRPRGPHRDVASRVGGEGCTVSGTRDFNLALLGYDRRQVDAFCDEVGEIVGELRGRADDPAHPPGGAGGGRTDAEGVARAGHERACARPAGGGHRGSGGGPAAPGFDLGSRAAATECDRLHPSTRGEAIYATMGTVLDEGVGTPLRDLLAEGDRVEAPPWVLVERIDGIVSELSAGMVAQIAETELSHAYERGKLATWSSGDVTARRWIVSQRGHRSDETRRSNADAGAVPVAAPFPSGEHTPPRREGCTCATVAADEESDP